MPSSASVLDSHVHFDLIERDHPQRIEWLKTHHCAVVSWSYFEAVTSVDDLARRLDTKARCISRHAAAGMPCHYLAGVHPRSIPPDLRPESIERLLTPFFDDPRCRGIGEIGLETGDAREREVFIAQLEIGCRKAGRGHVIGVHTPRANKPAITAKTLNILEGFKNLAPFLVVDHCTGDTIGDVLDAGFWAGITISPQKTAWEEVKAIAARESDRIGRIMLNTDSGSTFFEDAVRCRHAGDLPAAVREKLFYANAMRFFGLA